MCPLMRPNPRLSGGHRNSKSLNKNRDAEIHFRYPCFLLSFLCFTLLTLCEQITRLIFSLFSNARDLRAYLFKPLTPLYYILSKSIRQRILFIIRFFIRFFPFFGRNPCFILQKAIYKSIDRFPFFSSRCFYRSFPALRNDNTNSIIRFRIISIIGIHSRLANLIVFHLYLPFIRL